MKFQFSALTDTGRQRNNNEDAIMVDTSCKVAVLADGMGGYNAGEVASALAVNLIASDLSRWLEETAGMAEKSDVLRAMEICTDNANRTIFEAANTHSAYQGMGTTLVIAVIYDDKTLIVGHAGDSRAYMLRAGQLVQITKDHSLLQEQLDIGLITPEEAAVSLNKNLVTRALGVEDTVLLDMQSHNIEDEDMYLLCSDGLNDMLTDIEIKALLNQEEKSLDEISQDLINKANENGGRDNISVVLIKANDISKKNTVMSKILGK